MENDYKKLHKRAMTYAKFRLFDEQIREDFAQEYCLAVFAGKSRILKFAYIDFLRKYYGRKDDRNEIRFFEGSLNYDTDL